MEEEISSVEDVKDQMRQMMRDIMEKHLVSRKLEKGICSKCSEWVAEEVRDKLKTIVPNFYICAFCLVQEKKSQAWAYSTKHFVKDTDSAVCEEWNNDTFRCYAVVFVYKKDNIAIHQPPPAYK